jgi:hypothetical protein
MPNGTTNISTTTHEPVPIFNINCLLHSNKNQILEYTHTWLIYPVIVTLWGPCFTASIFITTTSNLFPEQNISLLLLLWNRTFLLPLPIFITTTHMIDIPSDCDSMRPLLHQHRCKEEKFLFFLTIFWSLFFGCT